MSFEFEVPLICFLFIFLLIMVYFSKPNLKLVENKYFEMILISSFIETLLNTCIHLLAARIEFSIFSTNLYTFINFFNKILSFLFILIFSCILFYTITITYKKAKENFKKVRNIFFCLICLFAFLLQFTNIKIIQVGAITSVTGLTLDFSYIVVAFILIINLIITILNIRKLDKRYLVILFILVFIVFFAILSIFFPGMLLADLLIVSICYIMYFTIENPDLKLINELEYARDVTEKANHAKSDFLSSMSHEIRTPLNAIVGLSEDMKTYKDQVPKEVIEDIEDILNASSTLLEIVGNILDINKIESGKMNIVKNPYDFVTEITNLVKVTSTRIGNKPIELKMNLANDIPYELLGDKVHIKEIINNLLSNAIKYTDKGKITINVNCINRKEECILFISVQDTGRGIKAEQITRLFTKFDRLDAERNTTTEGTGLGLAITKRLVEMMGGKINVQSTFGEGSLFMVQISQEISKKVRPEEQEEIRKVEEVQSDFKNKKVLLVDDSKLNLKVARKALEPYGMNITECESGEEVLKKMEKGEEYDLIFLDIMMPNMSGEVTLQKLKAKEDFKIPVVALTADAVEGAKEKYLNLGFTDYLAKPFNRVALKEVLDKIFTK